jgi:hypothetical protein
MANVNDKKTFQKQGDKWVAILMFDLGYNAAHKNKVL